MVICRSVTNETSARLARLKATWGPESRVVCAGCFAGVWNSWMVVWLAVLSFQKGADRNCCSGGFVLSFQLQLGIFKFVVSKLHKLLKVVGTNSHS